MAQPGILGTLQVYLTLTFDANANPTPAGPPLTFRAKNFSCDPEFKRENTTVTRGPGAGRGETGTLCTSVARVRMEGFQPTELFEGADWANVGFGSTIYVIWINGTSTFQGAVQITRGGLTNPADGVLGINTEGETQGNYVYVP